MYLGHLLFLGGLAGVLRSPLAAALGAAQILSLVRHIQVDEERLARLFGPEYADYRTCVGRWLSFGFGPDAEVSPPLDARLSGEYRAEPGEGAEEASKSLPRWSGEYRAEPGEGGEGALNYSS
jgi:hypothetical protein